MWVLTVGLVPTELLHAAGRSRQVALASVAGFVIGAGIMAVLGVVAGVHGGTTGFLVARAANLVTEAALWSGETKGSPK